MRIGDDAADDECGWVPSRDGADTVVDGVQAADVELGRGIDVLGQCDLVLCGEEERVRGGN